MKTNLLVFALFLLPCFLSAQIFVKLNLDEDGLYSVVIKNETAIGDAIVASGQITVTAPFGGFEVGEVTSINGEWYKEVDVINQSMSTAIPHDYFFIQMKDGEGISGMDICEEQTLLTFRNTGVNTGRAQLITKEDPIVTKEIDFGNNPYHDLSIFDSSAGRVWNVGGTYNTVTTTHTNETKTICAGESYLFHGRELTEAGIYYETLTNNEGCESTIALDLTVMDVSYTQVAIAICHGESYDFNGVALTASGIYHDTLQSNTGCDSILTLNLSVIVGGNCIDTIVPPAIEIINIQKLGTTSAKIEWRSSGPIMQYQLQVRIKDTLVWETAEMLKTDATKAYFYGPINELFEARVVGYYEDGTEEVSEIVELSTFQED